MEDAILQISTPAAVAEPTPGQFNLFTGEIEPIPAPRNPAPQAEEGWLFDPDQRVRAAHGSSSACPLFCIVSRVTSDSITVRHRIQRASLAPDLIAGLQRREAIRTAKAELSSRRQIHHLRKFGPARASPQILR